MRVVIGCVVNQLIIHFRQKIDWMNYGIRCIRMRMIKMSAENYLRKEVELVIPIGNIPAGETGICTGDLEGEAFAVIFDNDKFGWVTFDYTDRVKFNIVGSGNEHPITRFLDEFDAMLDEFGAKANEMFDDFMDDND